MADTKLSALTELDAGPAVADEVYIRDESEAAADESKRITIANLFLTVTPITGTTIDATTDFTIGATVITDGVITDAGGLQIAAVLDMADNAINNIAAAGNDLTQYSITWSGANGTSDTQVLIQNTSNSSGADVRLTGSVAGSSAGDAFLFCKIEGQKDWYFGGDNSSSDQLAIGVGGAPGAQDSIRITTANPGVVSFDTSQGSDFDYACNECGWHGYNKLTICPECGGQVEWRDDVLDYVNAIVLRSPSALDYMERVGVITRSWDNFGVPQIFTNYAADSRFTKSMCMQLYRYGRALSRYTLALEERIAVLEGAHA